MSTTDKVRLTNLVLWVISCLVGLTVWAASKGTVNLESLLPLIGPQTAAIGLGELSNAAKRATSKPDVIAAEADAIVRVQNGGA